MEGGFSDDGSALCCLFGLHAQVEAANPFHHPGKTARGPFFWHLSLCLQTVRFMSCLWSQLVTPSEILQLVFIMLLGGTRKHWKRTVFHVLNLSEGKCVTG